MGGALVRSLQWRNYEYTVVSIIVLGASVVFKLVYSRAKPSSGPDPGPAHCRQSQGIPMASSNSENDKKLPKGVVQLNESLYELYSPPIGVQPQIDIILFHGLKAGDYRNAYWKSWMSSDGNSLWPQSLLAKKFPTARILSVSYDSATRRTDKSGIGDLYLIAENYVEDIIASEPNRGNRPIVLVGHSIGGLLLKKFIIAAYDSEINCDEETDARKIKPINNFLASVSGVFYYSTPHTGTELGDIVSQLPGSSDLVNFLKTLSKESARLNNDFRHWRRKKGVRAMSLAESLPTDPKIWGVDMEPTVIVPEASCKYDTDGFYTVQGANHINICQPNLITEPNFEKLENFVKLCLEDRKVILQQVPQSSIERDNDDMT